MGNRLTKITTKFGDKGQTQLNPDQTVSKANLRVCAIGNGDELCASLGVLYAHLDIKNNPHKAFIQLIQRKLFDLGGELAMPEFEGMTLSDIEHLESHTQSLNDKLPPLKEFVIPGGDIISAHAHVARTVCRRAERSLVALSQEERVNEHALVYLNRLSDYLFILARTLHLEESTQEELWR